MHDEQQMKGEIMTILADGERVWYEQDAEHENSNGQVDLSLQRQRLPALLRRCGKRRRGRQSTVSECNDRVNHSVGGSNESQTVRYFFPFCPHVRGYLSSLVIT